MTTQSREQIVQELKEMYKRVFSHGDKHPCSEFSHCVKDLPPNTYKSDKDSQEYRYWFYTPVGVYHVGEKYAEPENRCLIVGMNTNEDGVCVNKDGDLVECDRFDVYDSDQKAFNKLFYPAFFKDEGERTEVEKKNLKAWGRRYKYWTSGYWSWIPRALRILVGDESVSKAKIAATCAVSNVVKCSDATGKCPPAIFTRCVEHAKIYIKEMEILRPRVVLFLWAKFRDLYRETVVRDLGGKIIRQQGKHYMEVFIPRWQQNVKLHFLRHPEWRRWWPDNENEIMATLQKGGQ